VFVRLYRLRTGIVKALDDLAAGLFDFVYLFFGFHAFGNRFISDYGGKIAD